MRSTLALCLALCVGCAPSAPARTETTPTVTPSSGLDLSAADRTESDRALDADVRPAEVLAFFRVAPGQRVADLFAGGGYTTELLARAVGPSGQVFSQNNAFVIERFARAPWAERLARPVNARVVRVERELDSPIPPRPATSTR
ncbi:MAG: hypothetical protein R3A52_10340 [Polyangiales bacterium]